MVWFVAVAWPLVVKVKERCTDMPNEIVNGLFSKKGVKMKKSGMHMMPNGKMMKDSAMKKGGMAKKKKPAKMNKGGMMKSGKGC